MTQFISEIARIKSQQFAIPRIDTAFTLYKPRPPLSKFVDVLWLHESRVADRKIERILPTGTLELVINLRQNELSFYNGVRRESRTRFSGAVISGAQGRGLAPENPEHIFLIGVHFKPGGAFPFLGLPAVDLSDTHVDLDALWGRSATLLRDQLCEAGTSSERFNILEEALLQHMFDRREQHYAVSAALDVFANDQHTPRVREIAKYVGLSERRFIQAFKTEVGLTPKLFSRIQRFQRARTLIHQKFSPDWPDLALSVGYCDQSHLIREFFEFSGQSPTEYLHGRWHPIS